jgi:hypothetical protein
MEGTVMATMAGTLGTARHGENRMQAYAAGTSCGSASVAKNIALFFAAPFIGLAYIIAAPFVGAYMIVKQGARLASGKK